MRHRFTVTNRSYPRSWFGALASTPQAFPRFVMAASAGKARALDLIACSPGPWLAFLGDSACRRSPCVRQRFVLMVGHKCRCAKTKAQVISRFRHAIFTLLLGLRPLDFLKCGSEMRPAVFTLLGVAPREDCLPGFFSWNDPTAPTPFGHPTSIMSTQRSALPFSGPPRRQTEPQSRSGRREDRAAHSSRR